MNSQTRRDKSIYLRIYDPENVEKQTYEFMFIIGTNHDKIK